MAKTVLVTGGAGFIAHHVVDHILQTTDWSVVCLDRLDFSGNLNRLHEVLEHNTPETRARVRIVYHDLKAEINPMISERIGPINTLSYTWQQDRMWIVAYSIPWSLSWTMW